MQQETSTKLLHYGKWLNLPFRYKWATIKKTNVAWHAFARKSCTSVHMLLFGQVMSQDLRHSCFVLFSTPSTCSCSRWKKGHLVAPWNLNHWVIGSIPRRCQAGEHGWWHPHTHIGLTSPFSLRTPYSLYLFLNRNCFIFRAWHEYCTISIYRRYYVVTKYINCSCKKPEFHLVTPSLKDYK